MGEDNSKVIKDRLRKMERTLGWELGEQTECCGVTLSQRSVILEVGAKGQTSLVDLAQSLGQDASTLSRTINGLVNIGLVRREIKAEDRRYIILTLTDPGRAAYQRIEDLSDDYFRRVMAAIPVEKHKKIVESFCLLAEALETTRKCDEPCAEKSSADRKENKDA